MMKGLVMDESVSNLTSTGEVTPQQSFASTNQEPASKKKRNLPGNPDPDAEVIALSPKSLMATNRFMCEICNKGFQRDQNLQLHRRGHNLPWKLKQRTNKEVVRKKVYVCPETTCVHHHPSRALGDLTGIKKHFCRKHGEKKWKCEKCSKRYAVQSDWKAHSKICGTREYRCDCGTLFSRRDSFITHRAFCDALAEETARVITAANPVLVSSQHQAGSTVSHMANLQPQQPQVLLSYAESHNARVGVGPGFPSKSLLSSSSPFLLGQHPHSLSQQNQNPSSNTLPPFQAPLASPHMSATALLQKAAQMGVTMSTPVSIMQRPYHHQAQAQAHHMSGSTGFDTSKASFGLGLSSRDLTRGLTYIGNKAAGAGPAGGAVLPTSLLHDMMSTSSSFEQCFNETWDIKRTGIDFQESFDHQSFSKTKETQLRNFDHEGKASSSSNIGGNDGLTRDFLGLKGFPHSDIPSLPGMNHRVNSSSTYGQVQQNSQTPWQG